MTWINRTWILIGIATALGWNLLPAIQGQTPPALEAKIRCVATTLAVGEAVNWNLALFPANLPTGTIPANISFENLDSGSWRIDHLPPMLALGSPQSIQIQAVPLKAGRLNPAIIIHYELGSSTQSISVLGDPIEVREVSGLLRGFVQVKNNPEAFSTNAVLEIGLENNSPFRLEKIQIEFVNSQFQMVQPAQVLNADIGQSAHQAVVVELKSTQSTVPEVWLHYSWIDHSGSAHNGEKIVFGDAVVPQPWVSPELLSALIGFFSGVASMYLKSWYDQRQLRNTARSRVISLLNLTISAGWHSSHYGSEFSTVELKTLWQDGLLFTLLDDLKLLQAAQDVLTEGDTYNLNIHSQHGLQSADAFQKKLKNLEEKLKTTRLERPLLRRFTSLWVKLRQRLGRKAQ